MKEGKHTQSIRYALDLRANERVEIRSAEEILATLDEQGRLDGLPFMPEMLQFCGQRFVVHKRADKTCDTIDKTGGRRLFNTVHLGGPKQPDGLRCDGSAHGGCEASCLIFWNEGWLKRPEAKSESATGQSNRVSTDRISLCSRDTLVRSAVSRPPESGAAGVFRCQATQLQEYTKRMVWWDVRQYIRDLTSGNVRITQLLLALAFVAYRKLVGFGVGYSILLGLYGWYQKRTGGTPWPYIQGTLSRTPKGELNLNPGELVRVKAVDAIRVTLDSHNKNQGLLFAPEMVRFCGGTYKVLKRVKRIINEKDGRMLEFSNPCIILQSVYCISDISRHRVFCPRSIYPYWREIWLDRINSNAAIGSN